MKQHPNAESRRRWARKKKPTHLIYWSSSIDRTCVVCIHSAGVAWKHLHRISVEFYNGLISGTKAYKETSEEEKSVVNGRCNHLALKFSVYVKERQDRLPTMYWLHKLHKRPYKARFIANSSSCTTTELSKLLTSCLTAVKNHVIRYCEKVYEKSSKNLFWSIKNSGEGPN